MTIPFGLDNLASSTTPIPRPPPHRQAGVSRAASRLRRHLIALAVLVAAVGVATLGGPPAEASADPAVVHTDRGWVRGTVSQDHRSYAGIPYALPPVGDRRWRAPQPAARWSGIRDATRPSSPCPQLADSGPGQAPTVIGAEDCLYLNVTTPPRTPRTSRLPVMVWIHGGEFVSGSGDAYDTTMLTTQGNVVTVTLNYRLGALGFLAHPALDDPYAGNYGLADQQAALRWVRRNIAAFGGDPGNVTLFGQSAGGFSVCAQLAAPQARGLFERAITQSGPCGSDLVTRRVAEERGRETAAELGCTSPRTVADCLRGKPASTFVGLGADQVATTGVADLPWLPVTGTPALPRQPLAALQLGTAARVPLIQGVNRDELRALVLGSYDLQGRPVTAEQYPGIVEQTFGEDAGAVLARYPVTNYPVPGVALATLLTDWALACPTLPADDAAAVHAPVYPYEFAEELPPLGVGGFPSARLTRRSWDICSVAPTTVRAGHLS